MPLFVIEEKDDIVARLKKRGIEAVAASAPAALVAANLAHARALLVAVPEAFEAGQIVTQARAANRDLFIVAHAASRRPSSSHSDSLSPALWFFTPRRQPCAVLVLQFRALFVVLLSLPLL